MRGMKHRMYDTGTLCVSLALLASLLRLPAAAGETTVTAAINLPHTRAEIDAIVENLSSEEPEVVLATLKSAEDVFRRDFKKQVGVLLKHRNADIQSAAFECRAAFRTRDAYPRLAERLSAQFPGPIHGASDVPESETDLRSHYGPVVTQFELLGEAAIDGLRRYFRHRFPLHRRVLSISWRGPGPEVIPAIRGMLADRTIFEVAGGTGTRGHR